MLTLTFDSCVQINLKEETDSDDEKTKQAKIAAKKLVKLHRENKITVVRNEGETVVNSRELAEEIIVTRGPWILGVEGFSELGVGTILADGRKTELIKKARTLVIGNAENGNRDLDFALLADHINSGRDWFITENKRHYKRAATDLIEDGIIILTAVEAVDRLKEMGVE